MKLDLPVASEDSVTSIVQNTLGAKTAQGVSFSRRKAGNFFWLKVVEIYELTFSLFKKDPTIWLLFGLTGIIDLAALTLLFFAPIPPISYILAPIIRTFWDDMYLHYPQNFVLLPKLYNCAHFLVVATAGVVINGLVIKKIEKQILQGKKFSTGAAAKSVFKRYGSLLLSWFLVYILFVQSLRGLLFVLPKFLWLQVAATFFLAVSLQSVAAFFYPLFLIDGKGLFNGLREGLVIGMKHIALTGSVLTPPIAAVVFMAFLKVFAPFYVQLYPELTLWILLAGVGVMAVADLLSTSLTTVLFLKGRTNPANAPANPEPSTLLMSVLGLAIPFFRKRKK